MKSFSFEKIQPNMPELNINIIQGIERNGSISTLMHNHKEIELIYVADGSITYNMSYSENIEVNKGDVLFINSMVAHETETFDKSTVVFILQFSLFDLYSKTFFDSEKYLQAFINSNNAQWYKFKGSLKNDFMSKRIESIYAEMVEMQPGFEFRVYSDVYAIMGEFVRNNIVKSSENLPGRYIKIMKEILDYINKNFTNDITLQSMCELSHMSQTHFCRIFKKVTGDTFIHYINFKRVYEAEKLLRRTDTDITNIAYSVGFSSSSYFCKIFKYYYKLSPMKYREMKKAEK